MSTTSALAASLIRRAGLRLSGPAQERMRAAADGGGTIEDVIAAATVGETYFFRERSSLRLLQQVVLPGVAALRDADEVVRVWSAGCATGEEAYTLVMAAREIGLGDRVRVLGTDLSGRAIAAAERAVYGQWSLRGVGDVRRLAFFRPEGARHRVDGRVRRQVRFAVHNLLDGPPGQFDIVVCRNVLIHLTPEGVTRAGVVLRDAVRPGGWLLTGASDPLLRTVGLRAESTESGLRYRRPAETGGEPCAVRRTPHVAATPGRPDVGPPGLGAPDDVGGTAADDVAAIRALGDAGRVAEALRAAELAIRRHPLDVDLWVLSAVLHLSDGQPGHALAAARAARFLDPQRVVVSAVWDSARRSADRPAIPLAPHGS